MKSLILAACVGSTVAVVAPQFPPPAVSFADAGTGMEMRPFSLHGATSTNTGGAFILNLGTASSDFVLTELIVGKDQRVACSTCYPECVLVRVNGIPICNTGYEVTSGSNFQSMYATSVQFRHGIPIQAGSLIEVESQGARVYATLAGYIR